MELKKKKNLQKNILSKSKKNVSNKKVNKNELDLCEDVQPNSVGPKVKKNVEKVSKKKNKLQSQKDYMKTLKKKDPEFFKALICSKDVLEGSGYSDEEFGEETDEDVSDESSMDEEKDVSYEEMEDESGDDADEDNLNEIENSKVSSKNRKSKNEEDDFNDDEQSHVKIKDSGKVTKTMINEWKIAIRNSKTAMSTFKCAEQALAAAIISIKGSEDDNLHSRYTVEGSQIFNLVVKFCLSEVAPALHKLFDLKSLSDRPSKNSNWKKLAMTNTAVKHYLKHLILLTKSITDADGIEVLLKRGILPILPIYVELPAVGWNLMKHVITLWCTSYEKVRVLSLIAIFRLIRSFKEELREKCMKALYASYVKNCVFTSPVSWAMIDFMRMSLVELYCLDQPLAYRHAFLYIKQLALHLRNALLVQKKERVRLVYNWQFIHCIRIWAELLGKTHPSKVLQPLIYPLVQVSIGAIGLMKTPKYFPLVFHVCNILTELSKNTDTFIPVMPPLLEILFSHRVHNRAKKTSMKPLQWDSIIKVSTSQMNESAFSDGVIDQVYDCLVTYLNTECTSIGFPELVFIASLKIKSFQKKCKVPAYIKKMKHLLDLINENSLFIEQRRKDVTFSIDDAKSIKDWEIATLQVSPPIHTFYLHLKNIKDKNIKTEQSPNNTDSQNSEILVKEKLAMGAQKKIGHHLLVKKDIDELEMSMDEDDEENLEMIKEEEDLEMCNKKQEEEPSKKTKSKKRKGDSSSAANGTPHPIKKMKPSNADEDEELEDDIVKEMTFSDNDGSSSEEENNVNNAEDAESELDSDEEEEREVNSEEGSGQDSEEDEESGVDDVEDEESGVDDDDEESGVDDDEESGVNDDGEESGVDDDDEESED